MYGTTTEAAIASSLPFRYRSYYYDTELGMYYLNTRYYDPNIGRFINADDILYLGANGDLQGFNLYAYCSNNPVMFYDSNGCYIKEAIKEVMHNRIKPLVDYGKNLLSKFDNTYSVGTSLSATPSVFILSLQECVSIDTDGNVALQCTLSGGFTGGTPGASISLYHMATNAPSVDKLEGSAYEIGGSAGIPIYGIPAFIGGDFIIIPDSDLKKEYYGLATNLGLGTPGGEVHITWGETVTLFKFNVFDVFDKIYSKVMEW